jgi:hypothetical protein
MNRAESDTAPRVIIAVVSTLSPTSSLTLTSGPNSENSISFLAAYRSSLDSPAGTAPGDVIAAAAKDFASASSQSDESLFQSHVAGWAQLWKTGIEVRTILLGLR